MANIKKMATGRYIDLSNMKREDIDIRDINVALNHTYRFGGHHGESKPLTVAQHTSLTIALAQAFGEPNEVIMDLLLHDASEAYYGDIPTPLKALLGDVYREFANKIDDLVYDVLNPYGRPSEAILKARHKYDLASLHIERVCMWGNEDHPEHWPPVPPIFNFIDENEFELMFLKAKDTPFDMAYEYHRLYNKAIRLAKVA